MRSVTHREMRNSSGEILRAVAAGESIEVTNNGVVAAVISPPSNNTLSQLCAQGQLRLARRPVSDLAIINRRKAKVSSAELVADARGPW